VFSIALAAAGKFHPGIGRRLPALTDVETNVYPSESTWTGGVYYIPSWPYWGFWWENPVPWGTFYWGSTETRERGFARFDLSTIPEGVDITSAVIHYFVYADTGDPATEIGLLTVEPHPDSEPQAMEVYYAIGAGTLVGSAPSTSPGWNEVALNADGLEAIEDRMSSPGWVGFGWTYPGAQFYDAMADGWTRDSTSTSMTVTYDMVGATDRSVARGAPLTFSVAPNPATGGAAVLRYDVPSSGETFVSIRDVAGRTVLSRSSSAAREAPVSLDLRGLSAGVYAVRLTAAGFAATQKLVVQR
jgi:hypothetical protein